MCFHKIEKPLLIAWNHLSNPIFQVVVSFEEIAIDRKKIIIKMLFKNVEACNKIKDLATEKNEENPDRLEDELRYMAK